MIQEQLANTPHATLDIVEPEPSEHPEIGSAKEGHGKLDFTSYVRHIDRIAASVGGPFDLIVVDGRAREACLLAALPHLADDGIIVFDNTMRRRYRRAIAGRPGRRARLPRPHPDVALPRPDQHHHQALTRDG